jgi:SAM-dependent methyltransferase
MPVASAPSCPACRSREGFTVFGAREMMFGTREKFEYRNCVTCGSLHLATIPSDFGRFYPPDYYSFGATRAAPSAGALRGGLSRWLVASDGGMVRWLTAALRRKFPWFYWARLTGARVDASILDVGCGSGGLLRRMQRYGFRHLEGIDPFMGTETLEPGLQLRRIALEQVEGAYDLIMFHHVLEHVTDPAKTLGEARERLKPGGRVLVRIPVAGSFAQKEYGADWFNLDAPRHLVIPSVAGMRALAARAGLRIAHTEFDSTESALRMSENYRRDISLKDAPKPTRREKRRGQRRADELNLRGEGDCGLFVLVPV